MFKNLLLVVGLTVSVFMTSCLTDEVAQIVSLRNAAGDTITSDTIQANLNTILTIVSDVVDDQDLLEVSYFQGYPDAIELQIDYALPIDLTNRKREVFVDLSFPDTLYSSGDFGSISVRAEDMEGNVTELFKKIRVQ